MVIIGKSDNGFIIDIDKPELDKLIDWKGRDLSDSISIGDAVRVRQMYEKLSYLEHNKKQVADIIIQLEAIIVKLKQDIDPIFRKLDENTNERKIEID